MVRDLDRLARALADRDLDGYLIDAPGSDPDQRYVSGFAGHDPFVSLSSDGAVHLLVRGLERALAEKESEADTVATPDDYGRSALTHKAPGERELIVLERFLSEHDVGSLAVPSRFPTGTADGLRERGIAVDVDRDGLIGRMRAVKSEDEIEYMRAAQRATEKAMGRAESVLASARRDAQLHYEGEVLTSERVKAEIKISLLREGYDVEQIIVACGPEAANPHERGSGPLRPNEPIVIDIFPWDSDTMYHADMTRTFCVGEPSETAAEWYDLTARAQDAAFDAIGPGVSSTAVHDAVCDVYEDAGIPTNRSDPGTETGFMHGTGHGVGLAVHEGPRVSIADGEELQPGHVVTIEPGVYDPEIGGVRIEDLVVVTDDGFENLTDYERTFEL